MAILHAFSTAHLISQRNWLITELKDTDASPETRAQLREELANIRAELARRAK